MNAQATSLRLHSYSASELRTYITAIIFIAGNIIFPQLCHTVNLGGPTWLPIYFFTLIGAYKYGWRVGLITALLSPAINCALFGMPAVAVLPAILAKSILLAIAASFAAAKFKNASVITLLGVVCAYQIAGTLIEWLLTGSFTLATQDFRIGIPGMLVQIFGGYLLINHLLRKA